MKKNREIVAKAWDEQCRELKEKKEEEKKVADELFQVGKPLLNFTTDTKI